MLRPETREHLAELRDRIIRRFDHKTASDSAAVHGPLIESILEELFPDVVEAPAREEERQS